MELYLIRHGEMAGDPHASLKPPVQGCLSERGCRQAAALAESMAAVPFTAVYASPLGRAIETAQAIGDPRGVPVQTREWLIEWRPATVTGECPDPAGYEAILAAASTIRPEAAWKTPAGEGCLEMAGRIIPGLLKLLQDHGAEPAHGGYLLQPDDQQRIALVAHGGSLGVLAAFLLGVPIRPYAPFAFEQTGVMSVRFLERVGVWYPVMRVLPEPRLGAS